MSLKKSFDCVEMKREIQEALAREHDALSLDEQFRGIVGDLETANDAVAEKWRAIMKQPRPNGSTRIHAD